MKPLFKPGEFIVSNFDFSVRKIIRLVKEHPLSDRQDAYEVIRVFEAPVAAYYISFQYTHTQYSRLSCYQSVLK